MFIAQVWLRGGRCINSPFYELQQCFLLCARLWQFIAEVALVTIEGCYDSPPLLQLCAYVLRRVGCMGDNASTLYCVNCSNVFYCGRSYVHVHCAGFCCSHIVWQVSSGCQRILGAGYCAHMRWRVSWSL